MRQFTRRGLVRLSSLAGAAVVVSWAGLIAGAQSGPRYWAGDVSFVTQAAYLQEAPVDKTPVDKTPEDAMPAPTPRRSDAPEPVDATRDAAGPASASSREDGSASIQPQPPRAAPTPPAAEPQLGPAPRQPIRYSGARFMRPTPAVVPRRMQVQLSAPQPVAPRNKPFESAAGRPTISPYLNLFREDTESQVVPDYFTYVRPQLEQQEANLRQQQQLEQIERASQSRPAAVGSQSAGFESASRSLPARFMNTAQFYSGWQQ